MATQEIDLGNVQGPKGDTGPQGPQGVQGPEGPQGPPGEVDADTAIEFTQAASRANLVSGESIKTLFGKIMKWFADLKTVAFSGNYNDLSNKPTSLPANGGNADTVGGKSAATLQNYNNLSNRPTSLPADGGDADTVDGKHATDLQNYNNLTNKPSIGAAASRAVANNLTTNAAGSVLDARQGKALNDKITSLNSALTVSSAAVTAGTDITVYNNVKHVAKYGKIVILQIMFSNKYVVKRSGELWVCTVPAAYRPSADLRTDLIAGSGIKCTVVAQQRDGGVNLTPDTADLPANSGMVIFMVWMTD